MTDSKFSLRRTTCSYVIRRDFEIIGDAANSDIVDRIDESNFPTEEFAELLDQYPKGSVIIDVGANIGIFSFIAADLGHEVHAFEASQSNFACLVAGIDLNKFDQIHAHHLAVSDEPGELRFESLGPYGHIAEDETEGARVERVQAITLDDYSARLDTSPVALIKIDVEGGESKVLRGMESMLSRTNAPDIIIESNGHTLGRVGETPNSLLSYLSQFGYRFFYRHPPFSYEMGINDPQVVCTVDYFCTKSPTESLLKELSPKRGNSELATIVAAEFRSDSKERKAYAATVLKNFPSIHDQISTNKRVSIGEKVCFYQDSSGLDGGAMLGQGWSSAERDRTWSTASQAEITIAPTGVPEACPIEISLDLIPYLPPGQNAQEIRVMLGEKELVRQTLSTNAIVSFKAPAEYWTPGEDIEMTLLLPNATRPFDHGATDRRPLAVAIRHLTLQLP